MGVTPVACQGIQTQHTESKPYTVKKDRIPHTMLRPSEKTSLQASQRKRFAHQQLAILPGDNIEPQAHELPRPQTHYTQVRLTNNVYLLHHLISYHIVPDRSYPLATGPSKWRLRLFVLKVSKLKIPNPKPRTV